MAIIFKSALAVVTVKGECGVGIFTSAKHYYYYYFEGRYASQKICVFPFLSRGILTRLIFIDIFRVIIPLYFCLAALSI